MRGVGAGGLSMGTPILAKDPGMVGQEVAVYDKTLTQREVVNPSSSPPVPLPPIPPSRAHAQEDRLAGPVTSRVQTQSRRMPPDCLDRRWT